MVPAGAGMKDMILCPPEHEAEAPTGRGEKEKEA
jgi:hypothetical protein